MNSSRKLGIRRWMWVWRWRPIGAMVNVSPMATIWCRMSAAYALIVLSYVARFVRASWCNYWPCLVVQWTSISSGPISWKRCKDYCARKITPGDARGAFYFLTYSVAINLSVLIVLLIEKSSYVYSLSSSAATIIQKSSCSAINSSESSR